MVPEPITSTGPCQHHPMRRDIGLPFSSETAQAWISDGPVDHGAADMDPGSPDIGVMMTLSASIARSDASVGTLVLQGIPCCARRRLMSYAVPSNLYRI